MPPHNAIFLLPSIPNVNVNMNDNVNNNENIAEFMAYSHINSRYIFSFYKSFFKNKKKRRSCILVCNFFSFLCKGERIYENNCSGVRVRLPQWRCWGTALIRPLG
jgi:hypothetical protein